MKGLISAMRTLTVIPVPGREDDDLSSSLPWFPLVGFILGAILYLASLLWMHLPFQEWSWGGAASMLGLSIWLTRGLHLDGLADWADSLGGFGREKRLAIMKDTSLGTFGVLSLVLALILKLTAFQRMLVSGSIVWVVVIFSVSRGMLVELLTTLPYARSEKGMGGPFVKNASAGQRGVSHALMILMCLLPGFFGPALYITAFLISGFLRASYRQQFQGITGDLLGASNEITEIILLMSCALPGDMIIHLTWWG